MIPQDSHAATRRKGCGRRQLQIQLRFQRGAYGCSVSRASPKTASRWSGDKSSSSRVESTGACHQSETGQDRTASLPVLCIFRSHLSPFASGLGKPGEGGYAMENSFKHNEHRTVVRRSESECSPGSPLLLPEGRERVFASVVVMRRAFPP